MLCQLPRLVNGRDGRGLQFASSTVDHGQLDCDGVDHCVKRPTLRVTDPRRRRAVATGADRPIPVIQEAKMPAQLLPVGKYSKGSAQVI